MIRRTKIVGTLGPATDDPAVMKEMVAAGLDIARINFSHGTREDVRRRCTQIRDASKVLDSKVKHASKVRDAKRAPQARTAKGGHKRSERHLTRGVASCGALRENNR